MGILSQDLDKTARRFVGEAVYGIMASQSVMLTDIGRQQESSISLKKIEERFSRQLIKPKIWNCLHQRILSLASSRVKDRTLLILDLSDLKKKYAEKMEHMATVRDGRELVDGYWTNQVIASEVGSNEITSLHFSLYSQASPDIKYYALGDGLGNIFSRFPGKLQKQTEIPQSQLSFGFG